MSTVTITTSTNEVVVLPIVGHVGSDATADIAAHAALTTGIHGVGSSTVDSVAARNEAITNHNNTATAHGMTSNISLALSAASGPSAANPFVTQTLGSEQNLSLTPITTPTAPTASINATAGNLNGAYTYVVTYKGTTYETAYSAASNSISAANQRATVTIPTSSDSKVTARLLYRSKAGVPGTYYYLATISDNSTTTYADNTADGSLGYDNHFLVNTTRTAGVIMMNGSAVFRDSVLELTLGHAGPTNLVGGYNNIFVGVSTGASCSQGAYMTLVGAQVAPSLTGIVVGDTAVGAKAGNSLTNGEYNTLIGSEAARYATSGDYNTALGNQTAQNLTTGDHCTFIGNGADLGSSTQRTYATAIGAGATVDADNRIVLGRAADSLYIPGSSVGIGNTPDAATSLYAFRTMSTNSAEYVMSFDARVAPSAENSANYTGLSASIMKNNSINLNGQSALTAIDAVIYLGASSGGYARTKGIRTEFVGLGGSATTIYDLRHIEITSPIDFGSNTIYDQYGLYINDMSIGAWSNYAIYTGRGDIRLMSSPTQDKLGFWGATPIVRPTGVAVSAAGIHAALVSLGLIAA